MEEGLSTHNEVIVGQTQFDSGVCTTFEEGNYSIEERTQHLKDVSNKRRAKLHNVARTAKRARDNKANKPTASMNIFDY